ncbi:hypothetical protein BKA70DRAFT_1194062 [Coprinopsis sp. MPI-PUGE-AT-0042]|nr:hypothetical protein BKA70DRAFT_1194062 [Coprinopsis sp. MPI-PUGE-AT-0042]
MSLRTPHPPPDRSHTPPPQPAQQSTSMSTPVRPADRAYAQHVRQDMQDFAKYPPAKQPPGDESAQFQHLCDDLKLDKVPEPTEGAIFASWADFTKDINMVCKSIKPQGSPLLVFKQSEQNRPHGHHCDTQARPDIVAAFEDHWYARPNEATDDRKHVLWPCVRLAGEKASKGENKEGQGQHALTYLDLFFLARPDLRGGFGLLLTEKEMVIYVAVGGDFTLRKYAFSWGSEFAGCAAYVLVHGLYHPGEWLDPDVEMVYHPGESPSAKFSISFPNEAGTGGGPIGSSGTSQGGLGEQDMVGDSAADGAAGVDVPPGGDIEGGQQTRGRVWVTDYVCVFGSGTFRTRTHVFVHQPQNANDDQGNFRIPKVLKAQLCPTNSRTDEIEMVQHIHSLQRFPGVINFVCFERRVSIVRGKENKHMGLDQQGNAFMTIETPQEMLMVIYDILEITRALYNERDVLHRDLSKGNVLFVPPPRAVPSATTSTGRLVPANEPPSAAANEGESQKYSFVASLLGKSADPSETSALLIDFNYSEHRQGKQRTADHVAERTGTPMFMARAIQAGSPIPIGDSVVLPKMPQAHPSYSERFPERCQQFSTVASEVLESDDPRFLEATFLNFRHELYHEAESIFWVMFYWILLAKPASLPQPPPQSGSSGACDLVPLYIWAELLTAGGRNNVIVGGATFSATNLHWAYGKLSTLIASLSKYLKVDPYWFEPTSSRSNPEFVHECFQREILNFLFKHVDEPFMTLKKSKTARVVDEESTTPSLSTTSVASRVALPNPNPNPSPYAATTRTVPTSFTTPSHTNTFVLGPRARSSSTNVDDPRLAKRGRWSETQSSSASETGVD